MLGRSRNQTATIPSPILEQLRSELVDVQQPPRPSRWRRVWAMLWRRRRSHGVPLAVFTVVWLLGLWVRSGYGPPAWVVALAGWGFVMAVYFRARAGHFTHTMSVSVFIAAWLFLAAL